MTQKREPMRLNRAIAACGICSRRKADELIAAGRVCVAGQTVTNPATKVGTQDIIEVDGRKLARTKLVYLVLNKPVQTVCTLHDPEGRLKVIDLLPPELRALRIFPVGRLDYFSEGVLILTNDGAFAQKLAHPRHAQSKIYEVLVRGAVNQTQFEALKNGMTLEDGVRTAPIKAETRAAVNGNTMLKLELRQGLNRQIRRMCKQLGLVILRLKRIAEGPISLGDLPAGKWRELSQKELAALLHTH